jgi:hypothetical protein
LWWCAAFLHNTPTNVAINSHEGQLTLQHRRVFWLVSECVYWRCLTINSFPRPITPTFNRNITIYLLIHSIMHHSILQPSHAHRAHLTWTCGGVPRT